MEFLIIPFILVAIFVVAQMVKHSRAVDAAWIRAGQALGLRVSAGGMMRRRGLVGEFEGFRVNVHTVTRGSGEDSRTDTQYTILFRSLKLGLRLHRQGFLASVGRILGRQDIEVGHSLFDSKVVVKGRSEDAVRRFLTPERRVRILRAMKVYTGITITDNRIRWIASGLETDAGRLAGRVRRLCELARALTRTPPVVAPLSESLDARRKGDLDVALEKARAARRQDEEDVDAVVVEGEILLSAGRYEEAADVLDEARERVPEDEEVAGLAVEARNIPELPPEPDLLPPEPEAAAPTPEEPPPPLEATAADSADAHDRPEVDLTEGAVAEALFGPHTASFESARFFDERYQGHPVRWSGELERVESFSSDMVFGSGPGTRAVFLIHVIESDGYGGREVKAVVSLPESAGDEIRSRRGERIAFRGTLVRCDAFMRNLFVAEGMIDEAGA